MEFRKVKKTVEILNVKHVQHPFSSPEHLMKTGRKSCYFCNKRYSKCDFAGVVMTDKGSKICCDDCAVKFEKGLENEA